MNLYDSYVSENGKKLVINPDKRIVKAIVNRLNIRNGYCPCRVEETKDTICPCLDMRREGHCCCKLYLEEK